MSDDVDIRILADFLTHHKTARLRRLLDDQHAPEYLMHLWFYTRKNRSNGLLYGMDAVDIATAAKYTGDPATFVNHLVNEAWLDVADMQGTLYVHDWQEHQGWATTAEDRKAKARHAAYVRHHGPNYKIRFPQLQNPASKAVFNNMPAQNPASGVDADIASSASVDQNPASAVQNPASTAKTPPESGFSDANRNAPFLSKSSPIPSKDSNVDNGDCPTATILKDLNAVTGRHYEYEGDRGEANRRRVRSLWKKGYRLADFELVHRFKLQDWHGQTNSDSKPMTDYVRPSTLYTPTHFSEYLTAAKAWAETTPDSDGYGDTGEVVV